MTLDKRITEFVQDHPGNWQIMAGTAQLRLPSSVLYVSVHNGQLTFGVNCIGGPSFTVQPDQLLDQLAKWEVRWFVESRRSLNDFPQWLVEPIRQQLRTRANELMWLANSTSPTPHPLQVMRNNQDKVTP